MFVRSPSGQPAEEYVEWFRCFGINTMASQCSNCANIQRSERESILVPDSTDNESSELPRQCVLITTHLLTSPADTAASIQLYGMLSLRPGKVMGQYETTQSPAGNTRMQWCISSQAPALSQTQTLMLCSHRAKFTDSRQHPWAPQTVPSQHFASAGYFPSCPCWGGVHHCTTTLILKK